MKQRAASTRRLLLVGVIAVLALWLTSALGFWQLRRAAAKEGLQQRIDTAANAAPLRPTPAQLEQPSSLMDRHVWFEGHWLADRAVYLDNRPRAGQAGFFVLMPLRIDEPFHADVIVNRGWLPRNGEDRTRIAPYVTPAGPVRVSGLVLAEEPKLLELSVPPQRHLQGIWQNFDFAAYARESGQAALPIVLRQDGGSSPVDDGLARDWPERAGVLQGQIDRHHGYAFQWFALCATLAVLLIVQIVRWIRHARPLPP